MISADTLRRLLEVADVRRAPYAVASASAGLLDRDPADAHALGHHVRALAALELGVAARRALAAIQTDHRPPAEVIAPIERLPAGVIPWSSRRRRFQANLRALEARGFAIAPILAAWEDPARRHPERYELHQAADGNFFVADTQATGADGTPPLWKSWLGGGAVLDHKAAATAITRETFQNDIHGALAFDGVGYGWFIPHVLQVSDRFYFTFSPPLYVVEPDLTAVCMVLHMHDLQAAIADPRLRLYIGPDAAAQYARHLRDHADWTPPTTVYCRPLRPRPPADIQGPTEAVIAARAENRAQTLARVTAHYARFDAEHWRCRFAEAAAGGPPLRVLGITTRYSTVLRYSMEELQAAARSGPGSGVNVQMEICMEPDEQSLEKDYVGMIDRFQPDLLITISRMRYENPDLPRNVPALCWDQDNLPCMRDPRALEDLKGLSFVAGHGAVFGAIHLNWPLEACIFCHPAGMTHRYQPAPASAEESAQFGSDVSYVSHASGLPEELRANLRGKWVGGAKEFLALFDAASDEIMTLARRGQMLEFREMRDLITRIAGQMKLPAPPPVVQEMYIDLSLLADRAFRHETLAWVAQWCETCNRRLRLWGNGWGNHPTLAKWAAGTALPGERSQAVYRASRINLQIIQTGILHSRLFDGWSAGGFFLIRQTHREQDHKLALNLYRIGQLAQTEGIETIGHLETRGSAELRSLWNTVVPLYPAADRTRIFAEFRIWRSLTPAQVLIPDLDRIMFNSAAEFGRLADEYCAADDMRRQMSAGIQDVLRHRLSYDARWREFLEHVSTKLGYEGTRGAGAAAPASVE